MTNSAEIDSQHDSVGEDPEVQRTCTQLAETCSNAGISFSDASANVAAFMQMDPLHCSSLMETYQEATIPAHVTKYQYGEYAQACREKLTVPEAVEKLRKEMNQ